jgi:hypothetical protein
LQGFCHWEGPARIVALDRNHGIRSRGGQPGERRPENVLGLARLGA